LVRTKEFALRVIRMYKKGVGPNAVNLRDLVLKLSPFRHSGESRNPGFSGFLDPGFRRGDAMDKGIILKLTALTALARSRPTICIFRGFANKLA